MSNFRVSDWAKELISDQVLECSEITVDGDKVSVFFDRDKMLELLEDTIKKGVTIDIETNKPSDDLLSDCCEEQFDALDESKSVGICSACKKWSSVKVFDTTTEYGYRGVSELFNINAELI